MIQKLVDGAVLLAELKAKTKEAALKELLQHAQESGAFPKKSLQPLQKRLADREAIGSTGLGNGVAVPHVKADEVKESVLVLARAKAGMEGQAIDGRPAQILFLLVTPAAQPEQHLQCLRWIATLARSGDFRRFLLDAPTTEAMRELLRELRPKA
jgi:mannitol/fructose-specific phosphotransferase system IIA component (Ntr-type)